MITLTFFAITLLVCRIGDELGNVCRGNPFRRRRYHSTSTPSTLSTKSTKQTKEAQTV